MTMELVIGITAIIQAVVLYAAYVIGKDTATTCFELGVEAKDLGHASHIAQLENSINQKGFQIKADEVKFFERINELEKTLAIIGDAVGENAPEDTIERLTRLPYDPRLRELGVRCELVFMGSGQAESIDGEDIADLLDFASRTIEVRQNILDMLDEEKQEEQAANVKTN